MNLVGILKSLEFSHYLFDKKHIYFVMCTVVMNIFDLCGTIGYGIEEERDYIASGLVFRGELVYFYKVVLDLVL